MKAILENKMVAAIVAALIALVGGGVAIIVTDDPGSAPGTHHRTVTVTLGGPGKAKVPLSPQAQVIAKSQAAQDAAGNETAAHSDLRAEPPAASSPGVLAHDEKLTPAGQPVLPAHPPLAAVHTPGCRTLLVRNYSSRAGAPILLFVIHFTVSTDSGWSGVLANVRWFDSPAAQASSNYIIDRRIGACALAVAEASKAWAQAGFNRVALSVEVTARGSEGSLVTGAGKARLIALMRRAHSVYKIPYRHGAVSGCSVARSGFVMHADLGSCGGGHVDVRPYGIDSLISAAAAGSKPKPTITAADRLACRKLNWYRARVRGHHSTTPPMRSRARARKAALAKRHLTCTSKGPVRG